MHVCIFIEMGFNVYTTLHLCTHWIPFNPKMDMQKIVTLDGFGVHADPVASSILSSVYTINSFIIRKNNAFWERGSVLWMIT